MSTVYKYCDSHRVDIIKHLEVKITPPNQFNDPFEFSPRVICSDTDSKARELIESQEDDDFLNRMHQKEKASGIFTGSFSEFKDKFISSHLMPAIPNTAALLQKCYLDMISARFGVLCLSKTRDSIVMFAHYGDEHHGFAIGFDSSHAFFQRSKGLQPVTYVLERVMLDICWEKGGAEERKYAEELVFSKNKEWVYEDEVRQLFLLDECPIKRPITDKRSGKQIVGYFYPIPPEILVSVSFGAKCPAELENQIKALLKEKHLSRVKCDRARLHESIFELAFE